jgi:hypothetical protein
MQSVLSETLLRSCKLDAFIGDFFVNNFVRITNKTGDSDTRVLCR